MTPAADSRLPHWPLLSEHSGAFLRLSRLLNGRNSFTLCFLTYSDSVYRDEAARFIEGRLNAQVRVAIDPEERIGTEVLFDRLSADPDSGPAQVMDLESWPDGLDDLLGRLNQRREALAERCPRPLLFWVLSSRLPAVATRAADLWAWRSGVFDFTLPPTGIRTDRHQPHIGGPAVFAPERQARIERLQEHLARRPPSDPTDVDLLLDLGDLQRSLGNVAEAETAYSRALKTVARLDDPRRRAITHGRIADIFHERGQLDEALKILTEEQLPVFEKLGDIRQQAITQARIADILQVRGQLDEALKIRTEKQLPVFEKLGDIRSRAITQSRIADILYERGQLDEALKILTEELPVFEELGDARSQAITQGQIADILQARGQLDEALRIRTEEQLPVFEKLGDIRSRAITQGEIANILQTRGQLNEALRIRTEEQLPVFERLGDVHALAITQGRIAEIMQERGQLGDALRIHEQQVLPSFEALNLPVEIDRVRARIAELRSKLG